MMTSDEIAAIRARAETFSGLQYVASESIIEWPWTSSEAANQIVDLVRAVPVLLDAIAAQTARAEAAERDWNDAIGYWHACAEALAASQARERALAEALRAVGADCGAEGWCWCPDSWFRTASGPHLPECYDARAALAGAGEDAR
jgi:hypothetical protein